MADADRTIWNPRWIPAWRGQAPELVVTFRVALVGVAKEGEGRPAPLPLA